MDLSALQKDEGFLTPRSGFLRLARGTAQDERDNFVLPWERAPFDTSQMGKRGGRNGFLVRK